MPLARTVATTFNIREDALVELPVPSINADYGTHQDLYALAVGAVDEVQRRLAAGCDRADHDRGLIGPEGSGA
jgi:hypothetical protein